MSNAFPRALRIFLLLSAGALIVTMLGPMLEALAAPGVPAMWWLARAFGLFAFIALWASVVFGVFTSGKGGGGLFDKATIVHLHGRWAIAAQVASALHVIAVVADPISGVTPLAAALPLASATLTGPVALGTLALWGLVLILVTTALSRRLSRNAWRAVHASAFGTFVLSLMHGITAGTDTPAPIVRGLYLITTALLVGAIVQRLLLARHAAQASPARGDHR